MYENLCERLLSIIPDIRWDRDSVEAIKQAVSILEKLHDIQPEQIGAPDDLR